MPTSSSKSNVMVGVILSPELSVIVTLGRAPDNILVFPLVHESLNSIDGGVTSGGFEAFAVNLLFNVFPVLVFLKVIEYSIDASSSTKSYSKETLELLW